MTQLLWMREVRVRINHNNHEAVFRYRNAWSDVLEIHFSVPFSDDPRPSECKVGIYNLSRDSINRIRKGANVTIEAGYQGDIGVIARGVITRVQPTVHAGVDKVTSFYFMEGIDYTNKKDVNISFASGTRGSTILRRVSNEANIPISQINLPSDRQYNSGYTADGDALRLLEEVAGDCGASIFFRRGNLIIRSIRTGDDERFNLSVDTGLLSTPLWFETDDYKGWSISTLLQHRIATASIINLNSRSASGTFRVKKGVHNFDGSTFTTDCEVIS